MFKHKNSIESFWQWFQGNEKDLRNFQTDPDQYLNKVLEQGSKIQKGLAFEIQPPFNGIINLTISADGVLKLFPIVEEIVSKAPKLEGVEFYSI